MKRAPSQSSRTILSDDRISGSPIGGAGGWSGSRGKGGSSIGGFDGLLSGGVPGGNLLSGAGGSLMGGGAPLFVNPFAINFLTITDTDSIVSPVSLLS